MGIVKEYGPTDSITRLHKFSRVGIFDENNLLGPPLTDPTSECPDLIKWKYGNPDCDCIGG